MEVSIAFIMGITFFALVTKLRGSIGPWIERDTRPVRESITRIISNRLLSNDRPRVMISGPAVREPICQICLGRIKEGSNHVLCNCGRTFHIVCLSRTGSCPYCQEPYDINRLRSIRAEGSGMVVCPICGAHLPADRRECDCGAFFLDENTEFHCPACSTKVPQLDESCPGCGMLFECYPTTTCPVCGQLLREEIGVCDCGAVLGERCPECHASLGPDEKRCSHCGAEFEFI